MKKLIVIGLIGILYLWFDVQASVTRFEFVRQLQESQCSSCYDAKSSITEDDWNDFRSDPRLGLDDIWYGEGEYYTCVAQTVSQDLMQWYPRTTSPFCPGKFCGNANTIAIDAAEAVIALMREQIARSEKLPVNSILVTQQENPFLTVNQLQLLSELKKRCEVWVCTVQSDAELQLVMNRWNQSTVSAPYAESRWWRIQVLLRRIGVERWWVSSLQALQQNQIDDLLSPISRTFGCSEVSEWDDNQIDSDSDGIVDHLDLCPRSYDPLQRDQDADSIGDVCDDDVDGDGESNVLWVIDYQWRIDQAKLLLGDDTSPWSVVQSTKVELNIEPVVIVPWASTVITVWEDEAIDYGDWFQWRQVVRPYLSVGRYAIAVWWEVVQLLVTDNDTSVWGKIQWWPLVQLEWETSELGVTVVWETIDRVEWQREWWSEVVTPDTRITIELTGIGVYPVEARLLNLEWELIGVLQTTLEWAWPRSWLWTQIDGPVVVDSWEEVSFTTNRDGWGVYDVRYVNRYVNDIFKQKVFGDDSRSTKFLLPGVYEIVQEVYFSDRTKVPHTNTLLITVEWDPQVVVALDAPQQIILWETLLVEVVFSQWRFEDLQNRQWIIDTVVTDREGDRLEVVPQELWTITIWWWWSDQYEQPIYLQQQVQVVADDLCLTIWAYRCDMDNDGISDVCDSDIDGDEIENPLWLLIAENEDCSIDSEIINERIYRETVGRNGVDVCPFVWDSEQQDSDDDGVWDSCTQILQWEICYDKQDNDWDTDIDCDDDDCKDLPVCKEDESWWEEWGNDDGSDSDGDGVLDSEDACPSVAWSWWCPLLPSSEGSGDPVWWQQWSQILNPPCTTCPCPTVDRTADLWRGDQVRALLYDESWVILYRHSQPYPIDEDVGREIGG